MPLCTRCKKPKSGSEFYTYRTGAGQIQIKNPCIECAKRNTRISKTRCRGLTANPIQDIQEVSGQSSGLARPTRGDLHQRSQHHLIV